jgi:hypothetical protein
MTERTSILEEVDRAFIDHGMTAGCTELIGGNWRCSSRSSEAWASTIGAMVATPALNDNRKLRDGRDLRTRATMHVAS